ncbi:MAG: L-seryl-tRNA(Sec) selenium transferase [Acidimicrobiia bacterium]
MTESPYRQLPSVDVLAARIESGLPRRLEVLVARSALEEARQAIGRKEDVDVDEIATRLVVSLRRAAPQRVVNATGVMLHTNLGRANWSDKAIERARLAAGSFNNVELDLETGERGLRGRYVQTLLTELTGAEAALVVNNNASALLLALTATSRGRAVPVARGELIEIGGSYRLPAVMEASGALLVEVGTTNRTRVGDYQVAMQTHDCAALLKVHPSNYRVEGFTEEATVDDLAKLAAPAGLPLLYDLGSGLLDSEPAWVPGWLRDEPAVKQSLASGADVVMFSGDKLLGGPQAGLIVGDSASISRLRRNPMARALRVDAVTYAALEATLEAYLEDTPSEIPFWRHALTPSDELEARSRSLAEAVEGVVEPGNSEVGAGSAPGMLIPSPVVRLPGRQDLFDCLLRSEPAILARRDSGDLLIDLRATDSGDEQVIVAAVLKCR